MPLRYMMTGMVIVILLSCNKKKESTDNPLTPPPPVFLKDIVVSNLPSPHYHFEYDSSGKYTFALFASGNRMYSIMHDGNRISELRNNTFINHDTLRYIYDANRVRTVNYIDESNSLYKRANLFYNSDKLQKIEWERNFAGGFPVDRRITFIYLPDGNLSEMTDHLPAIPGVQNEVTLITRFEQYDTKINKDDFMLLNEGGNPHVLIFPGLQIQKNNPHKIIRTGTGLHYTIDQTYTYSNKNVPLTKTGIVTINSGASAGQQFQSNTAYTYY
jgi:hypothetical protein